MQTAVVGHVEWVEFISVDATPASGQIVHAQRWWEEPGGGGANAAVQLQKLCGDTIFFTSLGDDELGHRVHAELSERGVRVEATFRSEPTRRAITHVDAEGERTITVLGDRLAPLSRDDLRWDELSRMDAVYFTAGDVGALKRSRGARVLVATARSLDVLTAGATQLDALVGSASDPGELFAPGDLDPRPSLCVWTAGEEGGTFETDRGAVGRFAASPLLGPIVDRYGAGDSFAAGLTYALAKGDAPQVAIAFAARCGAAVLTGPGPCAGQLRSYSA